MRRNVCNIGTLSRVVQLPSLRSALQQRTWNKQMLWARPQAPPSRSWPIMWSHLAQRRCLQLTVQRLQRSQKRHFWRVRCRISIHRWPELESAMDQGRILVSHQWRNGGFLIWLEKGVERKDSLLEHQLLEERGSERGLDFSQCPGVMIYNWIN